MNEINNGTFWGHLGRGFIESLEQTLFPTRAQKYFTKINKINHSFLVPWNGGSLDRWTRKLAAVTDVFTILTALSGFHEQAVASSRAVQQSRRSYQEIKQVRRMTYIYIYD